MTLAQATSVHGNNIWLTLQQWAHISEAHDYMAGNSDKIMETVAEPSQIFEGESGESLALRSYERTNITRKTAVVVYRDEPDGFVITAFFTSRPERIQRNKVLVWQKSPSQES